MCIDVCINIFDMYIKCYYSVYLNFFHVYISAEQAHLGLMSPARTKILVTLAAQFGGSLRDGMQNYIILILYIC